MHNYNPYYTFRITTICQLGVHAAELDVTVISQDSFNNRFSASDFISYIGGRFRGSDLSDLKSVAREIRDYLSDYQPKDMRETYQPVIRLLLRTTDDSSHQSIEYKTDGDKI